MVRKTTFSSRSGRELTFCTWWVSSGRSSSCATITIEPRKRNSPIEETVKKNSSAEE